MMTAAAGLEGELAIGTFGFMCIRIYHCVYTYIYMERERWIGGA